MGPRQSTSSTNAIDFGDDPTSSTHMCMHDKIGRKSIESFAAREMTVPGDDAVISAAVVARSYPLFSPLSCLHKRLLLKNELTLRIAEKMSSRNIAQYDAFDNSASSARNAAKLYLSSPQTTILAPLLQKADGMVSRQFLTTADNNATTVLHHAVI